MLWSQWSWCACETVKPNIRQRTPYFRDSSWEIVCLSKEYEKNKHSTFAGAHLDVTLAAFHIAELFLSEDSQALSRASSPNLISTTLKLKVTPNRSFTLCSCPGAPRHGPLKSEICARLWVLPRFEESANLCCFVYYVRSTEGAGRGWSGAVNTVLCVFCPEFKLVPRLTNESLTTPTEPLSQEICILPLKRAFKDAAWKYEKTPKRG